MTLKELINSDIFAPKRKVYKHYRPNPKENEYKPWRANIGECYFYISDTGSVYVSVESGCSFDDYRYNTGNYFKTEDFCEKFKEFQLAKQTLKNDAKGFVPDWKDSSQCKFFVFNKYDGLDSSYVNSDSSRHIYFEREEDAQVSILEHEKEWRIVFDWENGKR